MSNLKHRVDVEINAEDDKLVIISPVDVSGEEDVFVGGGRRVYGPKAWGGSELIESFDLDDDELYDYLLDHAEHLFCRYIDEH